MSKSKNNKTVKYFLFEGIIAATSIFICIITFITTKFIPKSDATKTFILTLIITGVIATTLFSFAYIYMSKALNLKLPIKKQYSQKGQ